MEKKNLLNEFTPSGGMNTDDSIVAPTPGLQGGVSLFQNGDYRYACNMRIGSSRDDSFGDGQPIKSTRQVENYVATEALFDNENFEGSLSPWEQTVSGLAEPWNWAANYAHSFITNTTPTEILFQPIVDLALNQVRLKYTYTIPFFGDPITGFQFRLNFMNNANVVIGSQIIATDASVGDHEGDITVEIPVGCTKIGVSSDAAVVASPQVIRITFAQVFGFVSSTAPAGTNKTIGKVVDYEFLRVYEAVYNSNGNHVLRYYDLKTDTIIELMRWSGFNWSSNTFVSMAKIDNWIAMAERGNKPRLIDTDNIAVLFLNLGSDFREFHISFAKWAPVDSPQVSFTYDFITDNAERFRGKSIQFAYRYIYKGNLRSAWSDASPVCSVKYNDDGVGLFPTTGIQVTMMGMFLDVPGAAVQYNYFNHNDVKCQEAIDKIEIAYRDSQYGIWKLWKTITPTTDVQLFTMDAANTPIANPDILPPYDTVPIKAGCVTAIDNRFVFSDVLEEMEPSVVPKVEDVEVVRQDDSASSWLDAAGSGFSGLSGAPLTEFIAMNKIVRRTFKSRGRYNLGIEFKDETGRKSLAYTADNWIYEIPAINGTIARYDNIFALNFKFADDYRPPLNAVSYRIVRNNCQNINSFLMGRCNWITPLIEDQANLVTSLEKTNIELADTLRDQLLTMSLITLKDYNDALEVLDNNPVYNAAARYLRRTIAEDALENASRLFIDIRNWWAAAKKSPSGTTNFEPLNNLLYNYRPGDRVRFFGSQVESPSSPSDYQVYDVKILEFTGDGLVVEKPVGLLWTVDDETFFNQKYYVVEVYTPNPDKAENFLLHDVGEWYPVLYPGTDQRTWSKRDWTWSTKAAVTAETYGGFKIVYNKIPFYLGDCSFISKTLYSDVPSGVLPLPPYVGEITSMNPDNANTYGRWERGGFRQTLGYKILPVSRYKPTMARFTGKIVEESFINNLNRMREEDNFIYPSEYGRIRTMASISNPQLESAGAILLMVGEREAWSVYVNRTTLQDLNGTTSVALSDRVLGSFNVLNGSHGTFNPESLTVDKTRAYWWDAIHGSWIRYGRDGLTAISDNKMRTWFKQLGDLLFTKYEDDSHPKVITGYDAFNEELLTVIDHQDLPASFRSYNHYKGSIFSEEDKRWKGCHTYNPDMFAHIGNTLLIMAGGQILVHEEGESYRTFLGVVQPVYIEPVFNVAMQTMKNWKTLALVSTHKWYGERLESEFRGEKTVQRSEIQIDQFDDLEDVYDAGVLNDVNTGDGNTIDGDKMRSKAIKVLLRLEPDVTTRSLLHYVIAGYTMSDKKMIN